MNSSLSVQLESATDERTVLQRQGCQKKRKNNNPAESDVEVKFKDVYPQIIVSLMAYSFSVQFGVNMTYSNLIVNNEDTNQASWIGSAGIFSLPIGCIVGTAISNKFGRRNVQILMAVPCLVSWILFSVADVNQFYLLITARVLGGFGGGVSAVGFVYAAEITHKNYRSVILSVACACGTFGILITTVVGAFLDWKRTAIVFAVAYTVVIVLLIFYMPESPYWLLNYAPSNNVAKAKRAFEKLNPNKQIAKIEWAVLERDYSAARRTSGTVKWKFTDPTVYKPFAISVCLLSFQQTTGVYTAHLYAKIIFSRINGKPIDDEYNDIAFVLLGTTRLIMAVAISFLAKWFGSKSILTTSAVLTSVTCLVLYTLLSSEFVGGGGTGPISRFAQLILCVCYLGVSSSGVITIPWTLPAELLPVAVRSIGISALSTYAFGLCFGFAKFFPFLLESVRFEYVFLSFGLISAAMALFTYVCVPQTFRKSADEIGRYFNGDNHRNNNYT